MAPLMFFAMTFSTLALSMYAEATSCRTKLVFELVCPDSGLGSPLATYIGTKSVIACSSLCSGHNDCRSFQYDPNTLRCWTNANRIDSFISNCSDQVTYGYIEQATCEPQWMFEQCSNGDDCQTANSTCVGFRCECKNGHPYDFRSDSCPTVCSKYGDTFHEVNYYLESNNNVHLDLPISNCFAECQLATEYVCRFVEYEKSISRCFLSNKTALTAAGAVAYENEPDYRQWDRNCA